MDGYEMMERKDRVPRKKYLIRYRRSTPVHGWRTQEVVSWNRRSAARTLFAENKEKAMELVTRDVQAKQPKGTTVTFIYVRELDYDTGKWTTVYRESSPQEEDWGD